MARKGFGGMNLTDPVNRISGKVALALNVRAYLSAGFTLRAVLTNAIFTFASAIQSIARLNDSTPAGPVSGFSYVIKAGTVLYNNSTPVATGMSPNPVSNTTFRPNTSVQPWDYIGDNSQFATIITKYLINGTPVNFGSFSQIKVRSDGLAYKTGIAEPHSPPLVSTSGSMTTGSGPLAATTVPWNNVSGANPSYNYGQTSAGDGTGPFIIALPSGSQSLTIDVLGTATVNGATHAAGDAGPATSTYPANFTHSIPAPNPTIVVGAFTDGSGNVLTGTSPVPLLANVGASITLFVPAGAVQFQIGIDSSANTFSANSGAFTLNWALTVSAIATKVSTQGSVTAYVFSPAPHTGPVATFIWKNPGDVGTGIPLTSSQAAVTVTNNSWIFDSSPEDGTVPVQWSTLAADGSTTGTIPLFTPALESEGYQDFYACIVGSLFIPAAGTYTFTFVNKDQIMVGIGGGATISGGYVTNPHNGQTMSVVSALPLVLVTTPNGSGGAVTTNLAVTFPGAGSYQVEIDWDYWEHTGRSLIMTVNSVVIPPLPAGVRTDVSYIGVYRSSATGALSNPSPASTAQVTPVLDNTVSLLWSPDPQVDKVDFYRQDSGLPNYTYVATGPNTNPPTPIVDSLSDLGAAANPILQFDNFEPFPSIDLPAAGIVNVSGGIITWVSGTPFNVRWLPGSVILLGAPTQLAYTLYSRPTSPTSMLIPGVPDGTNLVYNIAEPILANQPLPYQFGPTDNINFTFAVGDPLRPGTLYWCKGSNLDSAPDTNQMDVTDPSEPLVNGAMSGGRGVLASIRRWWVIMPNFFNAEATATGTSGSTWTLQATSITRGLFIPRCLAVSGGGNIFFRVDDGIHVSPGGLQSESISDGDLYPLFSHEGSIPTAIVRNGITIYPPDDTQPQQQQFSYQNGYLYYDYLGIDSTFHTLVFDEAAGGWIYDTYSISAVIHAANEDESIQGVLVGCSDGTLREMTPGGTEISTGTVLTPAIGGKGFLFIQEVTVEYSSNAPITLSTLAADTNNGSYGPADVTLPSTTGVIAKTKFLLGTNKAKLFWFQFSSADPTFKVYTDGFAVRLKDFGTKDPFRQMNPFVMQNPYFPVLGGFGGEA